MKIMFYGDNINHTTGYAKQAQEFVNRFKKQNKDDELFYVGDYYGELPSHIQTKDQNVTYLPFKGKRGTNDSILSLISYIEYYKIDIFFVIGNAVIRKDLDKIDVLVDYIKQQKLFPNLKFVFYTFVENEFLWTGEKHFCDRMDMIIPSSKFTKYQYDREEIKVEDFIYPGVDKKAFSPMNPKQRREIRKTYGYTEKDKVIFSYGRSCVRKNLRNLIGAAYSTKEESNIKFLFHFVDYSRDVGYDMADYINRICPLKYGEKKIDKYIKFTDNIVDEAKLAEMIKIADLVIFPTYGEGFGFGLVETLFSGTPLMASSCSTIPEIVGEYGIQMKCDENVAMSFNCFAKGPSDTLIKKYIESFCLDAQFEMTRKFWSGKALEFREKKDFSWDTWYDKLIDKFKEVVKGEDK